LLEYNNFLSSLKVGIKKIKKNKVLYQNKTYKNHRDCGIKNIGIVVEENGNQGN
jgi:hypothetical protein